MRGSRESAGAAVARVRMERLGVLARPAPAEPLRDIRPTVERRRQSPVVRPARQTVDSRGKAAQPFVALSTVEVMERRGSITRAQARAANRFHELFRAAALDGLKGAALDRVSGGGGADWHNGNERARKAIAGAICALGGEASVMASCAWHVLGLEWSLRDWSVKSLRGNVHQASGVLIAALGILEPHFGA